MRNQCGQSGTKTRLTETNVKNPDRLGGQYKIKDRVNETKKSASTPMWTKGDTSQRCNVTHPMRQGRGRDPSCLVDRVTPDPSD